MSIFTIFITILFFIHGSIYSQITISGTIKTLPDNEPVEYIHVAVKNTPEGAITNFDGTFELKLDKFTPGIVLVITGIGYKTKEIKLEVLPKDPLQIKIKPKEYAIDEVEIRHPRLINNPKQILRNALNNIDKNYSSEPFIIEAFYQNIYQDYDSYENLNYFTKKVNINSFSFDSRINAKEITSQAVNKPDSFWSNVYYDNDNMFLPQYKMPNYGGDHLLCLLNSDPIRNHKRENISFINSFGRGLFKSNKFFRNHKFLLDRIDYYNGHMAYFIDIKLRTHIWANYLNILNVNPSEIRFGSHQFYPAFTNGISVYIFFGKIIVNTEDFAILRFEYHNGYLHDRYKLAIEYQKAEKFYYPSNLYLGNKCFVDTTFDFTNPPIMNKGTIRCRGGIQYYNKIEDKYSNLPKGEKIIDSIMKRNTLNTQNTQIVTLHRLKDSYFVNHHRLKRVIAYSKALEDILYAFNLNNHDKILHHRILRINKIYKSNKNLSTRDSAVVNIINHSGFNKTFNYIGDPTFAWYARKPTGRFDFNFGFIPRKLSTSYAGTYNYKEFSEFPIPVTSVDEYRNIYTIPKVDFLTDKHHLIKGCTRLKHKSDDKRNVRYEMKEMP